MANIMHQSFETPAPPHSGLSRGLRGLSPHIHFILVPRQAGNSLEVTVFASPTGLFAGRSKINLFISWLPTVFFNQCVMLGNNKLFYKGSFTKFDKVVLQREFYKGSRGGGMHHSLLSPGNQGLHSLSLA